MTVYRNRIIYSSESVATSFAPLTVYPNTNNDITIFGQNFEAGMLLYLSGSAGVFSNESAIMVNGIDSGHTGINVQYTILNEYAIQITGITPLAEGVIDVIVVNNNELQQLAQFELSTISSEIFVPNVDPVGDVYFLDTDGIFVADVNGIEIITTET